MAEFIFKNHKGEDVVVEIGTLVTYSIGSDLYGYVVGNVYGNEMIVVYQYPPAAFMVPKIVKRYKGGIWRELGKKSGSYTFGEAVDYQSPEF